MVVLLLAAAISLATAGPLAGRAWAAVGGHVPLISGITAIGSSDAALNLTVGGAMDWSFRPNGTPSLVTIACAAFGTNVTLAATYAGASMNPGIVYDHVPFYVGIWYLASPPAGTERAAVSLSRADGGTPTECSATGWTGTAAVDASVSNASWEWGYVQSYLTIAPARAVPAGEVFFSALSRFEWGQGTPLAVGSTGGGATLVDANTTLGFGCLAILDHPDVDCVASAQLRTGGTSMTYTWAYFGGFAVAAGLGLVAGTGPAPVGGTAGTVLGLPSVLFVLVLLLAGISVGLALALLWPPRGRDRVRTP